MDQLGDAHGRIVHSPDTLYALRERVVQHLRPMAYTLTIEEQVWSTSGGIHMTGTWHATGTPVIVKLGINANQLYWTQQMPHVHRTSSHNCMHPATASAHYLLAGP